MESSDMESVMEEESKGGPRAADYHKSAAIGNGFQANFIDTVV